MHYLSIPKHIIWWLISLSIHNLYLLTSIQGYLDLLEFTPALYGENAGVYPEQVTIPGPLDCIAQFLWNSWFCPRNSIFDVTPQVFYQIQVWGLGWPLHNVNLVGLEPLCCSYWCVWGRCLVETSISRAFPHWHNPSFSSIQLISIQFNSIQ